ncbi:MAG: STAS domain-containing protein [Anaerolineales bacterium]|nr:STAS domain-containing protein [Anaerolineales bacterium]
MDITISQAQGRVPVSVIAVNGKLDSQTYQELIGKTRDLYEAGTRDILIDLTGLTYISSAGMVALHTIALLLRGESLPDLEQGWASVKSIDRSRDAGLQRHIKLLNPQPEVNNVLEMVGFSQIFEIFSDREKAVQAFE